MRPSAAATDPTSDRDLCVLIVGGCLGGVSVGRSTGGKDWMAGTGEAAADGGDHMTDIGLGLDSGTIPKLPLPAAGTARTGAIKR